MPSNTLHQCKLTNHSSSVLEPMDGPENSVSRTDQLIKKGKEEFKFKRTEDKSVENEVGIE